MSSNISSILISLTKVIIRYHDIRVQKKIVADPTRESLSLKAEELMSKPNENLDQTLKLYINECTHGYLERKPFLNFILYQIEFLKPIAEKKNFEDHEIENIFNHLYRLILDVKGLLNTTKGTNYTVIQDGHEMNLNGLARYGYYPFHRPLCDSGQIALEEMLGGLGLDATCSDADISSKIREIVDLMSLESQVVKLSAENQALKEQLSQKDQIIHHLEDREQDESCEPALESAKKPDTPIPVARRAFGLFPSAFAFYSGQTMGRLGGIKSDDEVLDLSSDFDIV